MASFAPTSPDLRFRPTVWEDHSDDDIKSLSLSDRPISSAKNIWAFWHSGWDGMKPWRHRNMISWVRRHDPSWQVRLLDLVAGSPRHITRFIRPELVPKALVDGILDFGARNAAEHVSDMARLPLLIEYGGVWLDVGLFLLQDLEDICWGAICDPDDPHEFCAILQPMTATESFPLNGFLASLPGNIFLKHWHAIFMEVWGSRASCKGASSSPLLSEFPQWTINDVIQEALGQDVTREAYNDYLAQTLACIRLISIVDTETGFSGAEYWNHHCRLFTIDQIYPLHEIFNGALGFSERRQYELFKLPRKWPVPKDEPEQQDALRFVEGTLTSSILKKLTHGPCTVPTVASLWDDEEDADNAPGTWGEYFRWATAHLVSPEKLPQPCKPGGNGVQRINRALRIGILEPKALKNAETIEVK